ncbi:MAG: metallophosphatase family protein [Candidatus Scalindua sp.]|nr:metallophosphatase family protein [Candidatus Scalindua sp.]
MNSTFDYKIGIISDTHALVRQRIVHLLKEVDLIVHAGDVGSPEVLVTLQTISRVYAVRGNVDSDAWADNLPETEVVRVGEALLYVLHDMNKLDLDPAAAGFHAVICGHSHIPKIEKRNGILLVNPGSAGPRRFDYPVSLAFLYVKGVSIDAEIVELKR